MTELIGNAVKTLDTRRKDTLKHLGQLSNPAYGDLVRVRLMGRDGDEELRLRANEVARAIQGKFEKQAGHIVNEYLCTTARSACALVDPPNNDASGGVLVRRVETIVNPDDDRLIRLESRANRLVDQLVQFNGNRNRTRTSVNAAMSEIFSAMTHTLAIADQIAKDKAQSMAAGTPAAPSASDGTRAITSAAERGPHRRVVRPPTMDPVAAAFANASADLYGAQRHIEAILQRRSRAIYFGGVVAGVVVTVTLCAIVGVVNAHLWWKQIATTPLVVATVFGSLTALASVFQRIQSGQLRLDINAGSQETFLIAMFRPFVGSVFAAIAQFAIAAGVLGGVTTSGTTPIGLFALVGAAAGFSERFATDMLERAGRVMFGPPDKDPQTPAGGLAALPTTIGDDEAS